MTTALITGASSGIGLEMARILARRNVNLVLVARREEILKQLKHDLEKENAVEVRIFPVDLTDRAATDGIFEELTQAGVTVDYLINNAGFGTFGPFAESDLEREQAMLDVNITALTRLTRHFLPGMLQRGRGRILNVSSIAAFQPGPLMNGYCATKAFVLHFSEALAAEVAGSGVTVTAFCPGPVATGFISAADMEDASLYRNIKPVPVQGVVEYGLAAMLAGKIVSVHGLLNRLMVFANRFVPRKLSTAVAFKIMK
jgi:short-subunit dehydrogenase